MQKLLFFLLSLPATAVALPYSAWDANSHGDQVGFAVVEDDGGISAIFHPVGEDPRVLQRFMPDSMGGVGATALSINDDRWIVGEIYAYFGFSVNGTGYAIWNPAGERVFIPDEVLAFYTVGGGDSGAHMISEDGWACTGWNSGLVDWNVHTGAHRAGVPGECDASALQVSEPPLLWLFPLAAAIAFGRLARRS